MFLLDTNVVSELRKAKAGKADRNVARWAQSVPAGALFLSAITIQELEIGTHADVAGLKDLGLGYVWALSARLLPEWMEHVYELTSPRAPEPD